MVMSSRGFVKPMRMRMSGGDLLLNATAPAFTGIQMPDPINLTSGKGIKTDMTRLTEKLDKLMLTKPKQVKKNIRVAF